MKYVDPKQHSIQEDKKIEQTLFDRSGEEVISKREDSYARLVKTTVLDEDPITSYYIKTYQNVPFDPSGSYGHREQYLETKFNKVSKETFDYYMLFLKTRNSLYMTRAQRSFIND